MTSKLSSLILPGSGGSSVSSLPGSITLPPGERDQVVFSMNYILDVSKSMKGQRIAQLNQGLLDGITYMKSDQKLVEIGYVTIVSFGSDVKVNLKPTKVKNVTIPSMTAGGGTPMGAGVELAMREKDSFHNDAKSQGKSCYVPVMALVSDGGANDDGWEAKAQLMYDRTLSKYGSNSNRPDIQVLPIAVDGADINALQKFSSSPVLKIKSLDFSKVFKLISESISQSIAGHSSSKAPHDIINDIWGSIAGSK